VGQPLQTQTLCPAGENGPPSQAGNLRRAYGFRDTEALKAMVFLCRGGLVLNPPLPGVL
jgi:hypothetical protein